MKKKKGLCNACVLNGESSPNFDAIVLAIAEGYRIEQLDFKNARTALDQSYNLVIVFDYWKTRPTEWTDIEIIWEKFNDEVKIMMTLYSKIQTTENIFSEGESRPPRYTYISFMEGFR
ncbi:MAG: hypothetical protein ACTSU2_16950 [Promethearchaeota archaeon]